MRSKLLVVILILAISVFTILGITRLIGIRPSGAPDTIMLISIDTLRADHLSSYGYRHKTTPHIDAFANSAVLFENCFADIPLTLPSHASMLSGVIPPTHGAQDNLTMRVSESVLTLPEILRAQGYSTYGIISADVLNKKYGLSQGFDTYDDQFDDDADKSQPIPERSGDKTLARALKWLEENQNKKKFMFIHFYDPHDDYVPPAPYDTLFRHPYDGEIAFVDYCTGQIIDKLKSLNLYDGSLIIITGDHGELLGEHGESTHGYFIYQNVLRVPLIVKPVAHSTALRVADNTAVIDITPTILAQSGIEIPSHMQGVDLSNYFVRKNHHIPDRFIFNECLTATKYNGNGLRGVINNQWHYIQTTRPELYNRMKDPEELNNLISREPLRARILQDKLREILETAVLTKDESAITPKYESLQVLESLGYVGGTVDTDVTFDQKKEDPKDLIRVHQDMLCIKTLTQDGKCDEAIKLCKQITTGYPGIPLIYELSAGAYLKLKAYDKAVEALQKKLALLPEDIHTLKFLAETYYLAGNYAQAIDTLNTILGLRPDDLDVCGNLADIYRKVGSYDKAIELIQKKLALLPEDINSLKFLAETYYLAGDYPQAIDTLNAILKLKPDELGAYGNLANIYLRLKSYDKAIELIQKKLALLPGDINSLKFLAGTYYLAGDYPQAIDTINRVLKHQPDDAEMCLYLAKSYHHLNDPAEALQNYLRALQLNPQNRQAHINTAEVYLGMGRPKEAIGHYRQALRLKGDSLNVLNNLAWILATHEDAEIRDGTEAVRLAKQACHLADYKVPRCLDTLAAAYAETGQFDQAVKTAEQAIQLTQSSGEEKRTKEIQTRLELYKAGLPYRESLSSEGLSSRPQ